MQNDRFPPEADPLTTKETDIRRKFGKVAVLYGGPSNEREVSLRSGNSVYNALIGRGLDAILLDVDKDIRDIIRSGRFDVAFIALHGRFGEDGTVQKMLQEAGIPYTGSGIEASRLALDKIASKDVFDKFGIPSPAYAVFNKAGFTDIIKSDIYGAVKRLGWPLVVKPQFEGSSIGLSIASDEISLTKGLDEAFRYGDRVMVEEYIDGRELTVGILGDRALPAIEIIPEKGVYDYAAKYKDPKTQYLVPAPIENSASKKAGELAERAHTALGCRSFSRVDMMMDKSGGIFVLEVNTIPGMTDRSLLPKAASAAGISFCELCIRLLEDAVDNYKDYTEIRDGSKKV